MDNQLINSIIEKYQFSKTNWSSVNTAWRKNTVPFIARYRKEQTGGLDEVQIKQIDDEYQYMVNLQNVKKKLSKYRTARITYWGIKERYFKTEQITTCWRPI